MTKEQLLTFIDNNYADGEHLVFQVMSKSDVETGSYEDISDSQWERFVESVEDNSLLADNLSGEFISAYEDWQAVDEGDDE
jgi:O-methyltransferase involved in polyketide biosynthesis